MNVLSLFDGMSCGQIALDRVGIDVTNYYASEIDKHAIKVTMSNYPRTVQLGDVTQWLTWDLPKIDLIMGGSPCQGFSFAGKQLAFDDPRSKLFFEFVECIKHFKPKYFMLENVRMKKEYQQVITDMLGVEPICINSSLVSAQNRVRYYWTNIPGVGQPQDRGVVLRDILESDVAEKYYLGGNHLAWFEKNQEFQLSKKYSAVNPDKAITMVARQYASWAGNFVTPEAYTNKASIIGRRLKDGVHKDYDKSVPITQCLEVGAINADKSNCLTTVDKDTVLSALPPGRYPDAYGGTYPIRKLTPVECERLQTVPDGYTAAVSDSQRYRMLGNGWTVDVIAHIFKNIELEDKHE